MTPSSVLVGEAHLLAFVFDASVPLDVSAEVMRVEDGAHTSIVMVRRAELSNSENAVYTEEFIPEEPGWHMVQYRALGSGTNQLVLANTSRFKAEASSSEESTQTSTVIRQVEEGGSMKTSLNTMIMSTPGVLSFRTRSM
jgi:hypothetical protein